MHDELEQNVMAITTNMVIENVDHDRTVQPSVSVLFSSSKQKKNPIIPSIHNELVKYRLVEEHGTHATDPELGATV